MAKFILKFINKKTKKTTFERTKVERETARIRTIRYGNRTEGKKGKARVNKGNYLFIFIGTETKRKKGSKSQKKSGIFEPLNRDQLA